MDVICVRGMRFFAYHGLFEEEHKLGQRFVVNLWLHLDLRSVGQSGDLQETVDYGAAYELVRQVVEGEAVPLLEMLAERVAHRLLTSYDNLQAVSVEVEKPSAPVPGVLDTVSIRIERTRLDYA